jgi:drug/metabolite transporter (DMT)-like permease
MIQRIQTIWLLLAATASLLSLKFSFYSGMKDNNVFTQLNGLSVFVLLILSVAVALLALATIFLFKNRKLQTQLSILGFLLQVIAVVVYFLETKKFVEGNYALTAILTLTVPVFFILAWMGIRKDEKLIKSMNRLR